MWLEKVQHPNHHPGHRDVDVGMGEGSCRQDYSIRRTTRCECAALWRLLLIPSFFFFLFSCFTSFPLSPHPLPQSSPKTEWVPLVEERRTVGLARLRPRGSWKRFAPFGAGLRPSARSSLRWVGQEENPVLTKGISRCFCLLPYFEEFTLLVH